MSRRSFKIQSERTRILFLGGMAMVIATAMMLIEPIPQNPIYHQFADVNSFAGIPNWQNVLSNLPFAGVGLMGLRFLMGGRLSERRDQQQSLGWVLMFTGVFFTAFGSAFYHWHPDNHGLFWDRLPMTVGFSGFFASMIGERISERAYEIVLWPLTFVGAFSALYWFLSESNGTGDLRPYVFVQFFPLCAIPLMMLFFPARYDHGYLVIVALFCYALAKIFEDGDEQIWTLTNHLVSGHAIKHLFAALGCYVLLGMLQVRRAVLMPKDLMTGNVA